jgi:hypothetical protein
MVMKAVQFKLTKTKVLNFLTIAAAVTTNIYLFIYLFFFFLGGNTVQCEPSPP